MPTNICSPPSDGWLRDCESGSRVVDLGCGNGALLGAIARPDWEMVGIDASETGIRVAQVAHPNIRFQLSDITSVFEELECPQDYFDVAISTEVIEHVYAPRNLVKNAWRLLRPGGLLIISTPYHGYLKNLALSVMGHFDRHFTALWDGGHIKFWSRSTIAILLREAGFRRIIFYGVGLTCSPKTARNGL
ncbi:MAG: class I SAM-dependent methyltransferase [Bryobacteraceae bacterium]